MQVQSIKISEVKPYDKNPRKNDDGVEAVANSIKEFGWQQPIVVDKDNVIIVGHTRYKAAKKLGMDKVPVVVADSLSPEQVKAYRLADNKTGELTDWDVDLLDDELDDILDIDMSDFGFEDEDDSLDNVQPAEEKHPGILNEDFLLPPFSIINLARKEVLDRKNEWNNLIQDDGTSRGGATSYGKAFVNEGVTINEKNNGTSIMNPVVCELINKWFLPNDGQSYNTFDCFAGDTAFGFVSSYLGNSFNGVELRQEQVDFNQKRVNDFDLNAHYICDDGQNVAKRLEPESQDLLFSCPPYFDLEVYSDNPNDASNQGSYSDFIGILDNAFTHAVKCLKDNRFATIVVGNIRDKNGNYYNFVGDIINIFEKAGLHFYNDIILQTPVGTGALRARNTMKYRKVVKIHQNLLVFYKGDNFKNIGKDFKVIKGMYDKLEGYVDESENL